MNQSNVKILVCTHKKAPCLNDEVYMPIQVGRLDVDYDLGFQTDAEGINIGHKHYTYSEFTAIYWAWKNIKDIEYIGYCHYRRYFCLNQHKNYPREALIIKEEELFKIDFSTDSLKNIFSKYDVVLPRKRIFPSNVWKVMNSCHDKRDMQIVEKILEKLHPEYVQTFNKCLKKTNRLEQVGILITRKEIFDRYCEWLFSILEEIEKNTNFNENSLHTGRKIGFIAEQLCPVYFHHHNFRIKHLPIAWINPNETNKSWFRYHASNIKSTVRFWFNI